LHAPGLSRFGKALVVALALHGVLALQTGWFARHERKPGVKREIKTVQIELEAASEPSIAALVESTGVEAATQNRQRSVTTSNESAGRSVVRSRADGTVSSTAAAQATSVVTALGNEGTVDNSIPVAIANAPGANDSAKPKIDLGLDGRLFRLPPVEAREKPRTKRDVGETLSRQLSASLIEDDVQSGHARGNVLLGALNNAAQTTAPSGGDAVIRVTVNSLGELSELELLRGAGGDWTAALNSFREQAKRMRIRTPNGARGLRITLNVSTKIQRPSGAKSSSGPIDIKRPSVSPDGIAFLGAFDLADLSNKTSRMVHSRVVSEEVL
jgi:hypothetical protein